MRPSPSPSTPIHTPILLAFTIFTQHFPNTPYHTTRIQHNRNVLKTQIDPHIPFLTKHLADLQHYDTINYIHDHIHSPYTFIGDAAGAGRYLAPYKRRNFDHKVNNYDLPIDQYPLLYTTTTHM